MVFRMALEKFTDDLVSDRVVRHLPVVMRSCKTNHLPVWPLRRARHRSNHDRFLNVGGFIEKGNPRPPAVPLLRVWRYDVDLGSVFGVPNRAPTDGISRLERLSDLNRKLPNDLGRITTGTGRRRRT